MLNKNIFESQSKNIRPLIVEKDTLNCKSLLINAKGNLLLK